MGAGSIYLEIEHDGISAAIGPVSSLVGVIVGLSLATVAIQPAFMDLDFLRDADAASIDPVVPMRTAAWTVVLGICAGFALLFYAVLPPGAPLW